MATRLFAASVRCVSHIRAVPVSGSMMIATMKPVPNKIIALIALVACSLSIAGLCNGRGEPIAISEIPMSHPPQWSSDGETVFAFVDDKIVAVASGGGEVSGFTEIEGSGHGQFAPSVSTRGEIVFLSHIEKGLFSFLGRNPERYDILLATDAGARVKTLIASVDEKSNPVWSPDGSRIAFLSFPSAGPGVNDSHENGTKLSKIGTIASDGSDLRFIDNLANPMTLAWSPDGSRIATIETRISNPNLGLRISTVGLDGAAKQIVYEHTGFGAELDLTDVEGPLIVLNPDHIEFSRSGDEVFFLTHDWEDHRFGINAAMVDGSQWRLLGDYLASYVRVSGMDVSPLGDELAVTVESITTSQGGVAELLIIDIDTGSRKTLFRFEHFDRDGIGARVLRASWSPDGRRIAVALYESKRLDIPNLPAYESVVLCVLDSNGATTRKLIQRNDDMELIPARGKCSLQQLPPKRD